VQRTSSRPTSFRKSRNTNTGGFNTGGFDMNAMRSRFSIDRSKDQQPGTIGGAAPNGA